MPIRKYKQELGFLLLILVIALLWQAGKFFKLDAEAIQKSLKGFPLILSGSLYVALYVVVTFFVFFSKDVFWLSGALLFGPGWSTLFICVAETFNAFILFYLARTLGRAYVEKKLSSKYEDLDVRLGKISFLWLFIFRAAPLIPYRFMDLAAGLTSIRFKKYLAAVVLGSPLKMYWIQYVLFGVGSNILRNPYALVEYFVNNSFLMLVSFVYVVLVILVVYKLRART
jgi:uncharacterized membrane protein YdjX (TVP38/TMEM64 family)